MSGPRTVGYVSQAPFIGGAERSLLRLAGGLDSARYRPFVIAGSRGAFAGALRGAGLEHGQVDMPRPDRSRPWPFARSVAQLVVQLRRQRAALVHINDATAHPAAAIAARILGLPRICHLRFPYPADGLRWYLKWGFERAVFASSWLQTYAQSCCPELFQADRCAVVYNGFDPPPPPDSERLAELRRSSAIDGNEPVVGFVGRIVEGKGVEEFLHIAASLLRRVPCLFLVVGDDQRATDPSYRAQMEALAASLGIAPACRFLGFREQVWELLHLCAVVVVPSRVEAFGNVVVEAGAAGRAVVATRVGGIPEIVRHGESGLLVEPGDTQALTDAVALLLSDPALRDALGARARARAASDFSLREHTARMMDLYDQLIPSGGGRFARRRAERAVRAA